MDGAPSKAPDCTWRSSSSPDGAVDSVVDMDFSSGGVRSAAMLPSSNLWSGVMWRGSLDPLDEHRAVRSPSSAAARDGRAAAPGGADYPRRRAVRGRPVTR
ncbi:hypothetical protein GCM10020366_28230 [Saccharopolyspora gregorii]|uniref:Uncharacterized protein n=1 Tax=Saccharopolyspora gregorii TaxID=33914 RepID=A0ABP6RV47_9PSEU